MIPDTRNFLLFMPNTDSATTLHTVFTFYADILTLSAEGDSVMSEKSLEGTGTTIGFLLSILFGSIIRIAFPTWQPSKQDPTSLLSSNSFLSSSPTSSSSSLPESDTHLHSPDVLRETDDPDDMNPAASQSCAPVPHVTIVSGVSSSTSTTVAGATPADLSTYQDTQIENATRDKVKRSVLINYIPDPGYFIAGAVAGGISRTATAPLDRLKVYLLVNTKSEANAALNAAKRGQPIAAFRNAGRPLVAAVSDLYKSGGVRGFFAGKPLALNTLIIALNVTD
jgi:solute carrier family 25 (mitochondrial phosphate transporter), member 23/24/25/41